MADLQYWQADEALRMEARLLDQVASGSRAYGCEIWATEQCLIAPQRVSRKPGFAVAVATLAARGWPVFLRNTGGDVTPQGPGIMNISIAFALPEGQPPTIERVFEVLCAPIFAALDDLGHQGRFGAVAESFCDGDYNVTVEGRKIAGTAQRWRRLRSLPGRRAVLAHALLLYDADLARGVEAVNSFRKICGETGEIRAGAHLNVSALRPDAQSMPPLDTLANRLKARFERDLQHLTNISLAQKPKRRLANQESGGVPF